MRATFMNRLVFAEQNNFDSIKYVHQFRVNVDVFITKQQKENRDWDLCFSTSNRSSLPAHIRQGLIQEFMTYLRKRTKGGIDGLSYNDFMSMAKAVNIL